MYNIITEIEYPQFFNKGQLDYSRLDLDIFQKEEIPLNILKNKEGHFLITSVLKQLLIQTKTFSLIENKVETFIKNLQSLKEYDSIFEEIKHLAFTIQNIDVAIDFVSFLQKKFYVNLNQPLGYSTYFLKNIGKTPLMVVDNPKFIQFLLDSKADLNVLSNSEEVYQNNSTIIDNLQAHNLIWNGQINYFHKIHQKTAYELAIYEKKKVKIRLLKNVKADLLEVEEKAFNELIQENRIFRKLQLFVDAIRFDNQYVLNHLDDFRLKDVIHYDGGHMGKNVLSHAIEQNNMNYIQKLIEKSIFLKKNKFSNALPISYLHYAIAHNKDYLATFFYDQKFYNETSEEILQYIKKYHHRGLFDKLYGDNANNFELKDIILSLSWDCLEHSYKMNRYSQEEIKNTFIQLAPALMGNKTLDDEFLSYSSLSNKCIFSLLNQLSRDESNVLFNDFTQNLIKSYNKLKIEYWNSSYFLANKKQLFNLYIAVKSILPQYTQTFFDLAKSLEPEHTMFVKAEKYVLEQLLVIEESTKRKKVKI